jgi:dCTP deaminase
MSQLTDRIILEELKKGNIIIDPFNEENLNPTSVDLTLGNECTVLCREAIGQHVKDLYKVRIPKNKHDVLINPKKPTPNFKYIIEEETLLRAGHLYLIPCVERIGCLHNIGIKVEGKSSYARLGLDIHICGGHVETGFIGDLVLEIRPTYDIILYTGMSICQIVFYRTEGTPLNDYGKLAKSKYLNQKGSQESLAHLNFKD